jgi:hypothetical protein
MICVHPFIDISLPIFLACNKDVVATVAYGVWGGGGDDNAFCIIQGCEESAPSCSESLISKVPGHTAVQTLRTLHI